MKQEKLYIIRKFVFAPSAQDAISREGKHEVDEVWVDEDWKKAYGTPKGKSDDMGFKILESNKKHD